MPLQHPRTCPQCGTANSRQRLECATCGAALVVYMPERARLSLRALWAIILGTLGLLIIAGGWISSRLAGDPELLVAAGCFALLAGLAAAVLGVSGAIEIRRHGLRRTGRELADLGLLLGLVTMLILALMLPSTLAQLRWAKPRPDAGAPAREVLRTLASALEAYFSEQGAYPPTLAALTTPEAYMAAIPADPHAISYVPVKYWTPAGASVRPGWIVWSAGPDRDDDLSSASVALIYDPRAAGPTPRLKNIAYDPTNGSRSNGDIWRIRQ